MSGGIRKKRRKSPQGNPYGISGGISDGLPENINEKILVGIPERKYLNRILAGKLDKIFKWISEEIPKGILESESGIRKPIKCLKNPGRKHRKNLGDLNVSFSKMICQWNPEPMKESWIRVANGMLKVSLKGSRRKKILNESQKESWRNT